MSVEIERKFRVDPAQLPDLDGGERIVQGYILTQSKTAVRIRIRGKAAYLTIKGETRGTARLEFEYPIPLSDAEQMLQQLCDGPTIDKTRYEISYADHLWEIDRFHGDNQGLIIAEIELQQERELFERPPWISAEVSDDPRYFNVNLAANPYCHWGD